MTNLQLPIFYAPDSKHWKRAKFLTFAAATIVAAIIGVFLFSLYLTPSLG